MSSTTPSAGSIVFTTSGQECELICTTPLGDHLVQPLYENDDGEPEKGEAIVVRRIYDEPPVAKINEQIIAVNGLLQKAREELAATKAELAAANEAKSSIAATIQKHAALRRVADFIDGKITHFVSNEYGRVWISTPADEATDDGDTWSRTNGTRLLTLYGSSNGDLAWQLNHYRDGSGRSREVYPCASEDEAKALATSLLLRIFTEAGKSNHLHINTSTIESAAKLGVPIPADIAKRLATQRADAATATIKRLNEELAKAHEELAKATATQATEPTETQA